MTREEAIADIKFAEYKLEKVFPGLNEALEMAIKALEQEPIIRCKDCEYSRVYALDSNEEPQRWCVVGIVKAVDDDDYCSYGEQIESGE